MKRILSALLVLAMTGLAGCGAASAPAASATPQASTEVIQQKETADPATDTTPLETETSEPAAAATVQYAAEEAPADAASGSTSSKVLVIYFSRTGEQYNVGVIEKGNTAIVADMIIEATGADSWEILPADDHYPTDNYKALTDIGLQEQRDNARPAIAGNIPDFNGYDTIFIGSPVWWGDWPMIMYTFFENTELSGKTLIPFSTHGGSGLSGFDRSLATAFPNCTVGKGLAIAGTDAQNNQDKVRDNVASWLSGLGF